MSSAFEEIEWERRKDPDRYVTVTNEEFELFIIRTEHLLMGSERGSIEEPNIKTGKIWMVTKFELGDSRVLELVHLFGL